MTARRRFRATVRYWNPEQARGLAVADVPPDVATALGGLKQQRVRGSANGAEFTSNTMPAGGGRLTLSLGRKILEAAGLGIGDEGEFELERLEA